MKRILILILFLSVSRASIAQREATRWYFGNEAGLDFNSGLPIPFTDGQLATHEGCSTISDQNGNLLFYSDRINAWDKTRRLMPNETGLLGHESNTQSAIIVSKAGSKTQYYIFTGDEPDPERTDNAGLNYTSVNLSLNSGLGNVVSSKKNVHLITYDQNNPKESQLKCSEKITAVAHNDENSIWPITHFNTSFYGFPVDKDVVTKNPVISVTDSLVPTLGYKQNGIGYLKALPDGMQIGVAHSQPSDIKLSGPIATSDSGKQFKVLRHNFNSTTGRISEEIVVLSNRTLYGLEFSNKPTKLYTTINNHAGDGKLLGSTSYQFDLSKTYTKDTIEEIITSCKVARALQLSFDYILERFGQVLVQVDPSSSGWHGTYNGKEPASSGFWFRVVSSETATNVQLSVLGPNGKLRIEVVSDDNGAYEYAIDVIDGPFRESAVFENIPLGLHTLYVRDMNGFGIVQGTIEPDLTLEGFLEFSLLTVMV